MEELPFLLWKKQLLYIRGDVKSHVSLISG